MSNTEWEQIGTVEILRDRVYPVDPLNRDFLRTEALVEAGSYPIYRKADAITWLMTDYLNERREKIGDGLFVVHSGDNPTGGLQVSFTARIFGVEEFLDLIADPVSQPGPDQRLDFHLGAAVTR